MDSLCGCTSETPGQLVSLGPLITNHHLQAAVAIFRFFELGLGFS